MLLLAFAILFSLLTVVNNAFLSKILLVLLLFEDSIFPSSNKASSFDFCRLDFLFNRTCGASKVSAILLLMSGAPK
jgi:hypothetical protein